MGYDIDYIRNQFPALEIKVNGWPAAFFDGPGGTQVPRRVTAAMNDYLYYANANKEGQFHTSRESDRIIHEGRETVADFLGCQWDEVAFGENATTIIFKLALAIARDLSPGDEILITDIDHEANRGPWLSLAERGITVKTVQIDTETLTIDMEDYIQKLSDKTKVVALNYACNAVGTISDVKTMAKMAHDKGAVVVVDAVHFALHKPIDVKDIDVDFLICSAYKFFGPHFGLMYAKKNTLQAIRTYKLRPQHDEAPYRIETGTLNHEAIAGTKAAIEFIADIGSRSGASGKSRRGQILAGMEAMECYEMPLTRRIIEQLSLNRKIRIYGPPEGVPRTSTVSFNIEGRQPLEVAKQLGDHGLFVWHGHFYAMALVERVGLMSKGGLIRVGLSPYNTKEEVERLIDKIQEIAG